MGNHNYSSEDIIILLGAGASVDAGMPTVNALTARLRQSLSKLKEKEYGEIFDLIASMNPNVKSNYEEFFRCVHLITQVKLMPQLFSINIPEHLNDKIELIPFFIGDIVKEILVEHHEKIKPDYLSSLKRIHS